MNELKIFTSDDIPSVFPDEFAIPYGYTEVGEEAFAGFCTITKIVIPNTVRKISKSAFEDCTNLTAIEIPDSVTVIGESAFDYCVNLESIVIPNSVVSLGKKAFYGCKKLANVVLPKTLTFDKESVFEGCNPKLNYYTDSEERVICTLDSQELFLKNAFLFYDNAERILADNKMSHAIVDIKSGMSMTGEFKTPTLGAYIEWWLNCPYNITKDKDGKSMLVYSVAGSILSGYNESKIVYPDGSLSQVNLPNFHGICKMFGSLCRKYNDSRVGIEAYTLQEVVNLIKQES